MSKMSHLVKRELPSDNVETHKCKARLMLARAIAQFWLTWEYSKNYQSRVSLVPLKEPILLERQL